MAFVLFVASVGFLAGIFAGTAYGIHVTEEKWQERAKWMRKR